MNENSSQAASTFKLAVAETAKPANDDAPRCCCLTHDSDQKVPELLQRRPSDGERSALTTEQYVDVDAGRLEQFTARVRARREQPALVRTQAVRTQQDVRTIDRVQQGRADAAWRRQHER